MTKGTPSQGHRHHKTHMLCRRCGKQAYHMSNGICAACGFGHSAKLKRYSWMTKKLDGTRVA